MTMTHNFTKTIFTKLWLIVGDYYYAMDNTWVECIPHVGKTYNKRGVLSKGFTNPQSIDTQLSNVTERCWAIRNWLSRWFYSDRWILLYRWHMQMAKSVVSSFKIRVEMQKISEVIAKVFPPLFLFEWSN